MFGLGRFFVPKETDSARFERLESKVRGLEDELSKVERGLKGLELDWEQTYDKITHLMARITKRQKAAAAENAQPEAQEPPEASNGRPPGSHAVIGTHSVLADMRRRNGLLPR